MALIEKPGGGFRAIGVFATFYSVWGHLARDVGVAWEAGRQRPFFAAAEGPARRPWPGASPC
eukprot:2931338-Lingulodinium_polyedra.AAC.1